MASGAKDATGCWCASAEIGAEVLARVPEAAQGVACVCEKCASTGGPRVSRPLKTVGTPR
jgi:hypothetical protein